MEPSTFREILVVLEKNLDVQPWSKSLAPFEVLVATILSQATSRENTIRAFQRLRDRFELTPKTIAAAPLEEIKECIRPAGLHNVRAVKLKMVAERIMDEQGSDLENILKMPLDEARKKLLGLPGVGEKTADIMLNFVAERETLPIDTHIFRISKRLGLVGEKARYEETRSRLEDLIPPEIRGKAHLLLIAFGRQVCKARNPKCSTCPIWNWCIYRRNLNENSTKT